MPGPLAPNVSVVLDDGSTLDLNDQYHPVLLFFWATWCASCHQMMPMIDQIAAECRNRVTLVARESTLPDVEEDVAEYLPSGQTRWTLDEDGTVCDAFGIPANPITVLVVGPVEADRWFGLVPGDEITDRLDEVLALYES